MDSFLTITSTKTDLESTSFLSSLDMDPGQATNLTSPAGSRVSLMAGASTGESILAVLSSPQLTSQISSGSDTPPKSDGSAKREVFSDFRRLMSFAVRRDTVPPS